MSIEDIKNRLAAATPGPWESGWDGQEFYVAPVSGRGDYYHRIAEWTYAIRPGNSIQQSECDTQDAEFIAHAPEDIAWLLGEVERQRSRAKFFEGAAARATRELNAFHDAHEQCSEADS